MIKTLGVKIDTLSYLEAERQIITWSHLQKSRYVCFANAHTVMEARDSISFREIINRADLVTPDGMPLVWLIRWKGYPNQERVYGPTLMLHLLAAATNEKIPVGFFGGSSSTLFLLLAHVREIFPDLSVAYAYSPPYRELTEQEEILICDEINDSGARFLFVGLGCPKQEIWMAKNRDKINTVMLGVGAAFDFHARVKPQAPGWMQKSGLEWFFRFITEPRRLWRRYLFDNPRFIILAISDLFGWVH